MKASAAVPAVDRYLAVPTKVLAMPENAFLGQFHNKPVAKPKRDELRTADEAFAWHRANLLSQWS